MFSLVQAPSEGSLITTITNVIHTNLLPSPNSSAPISWYDSSSCSFGIINISSLEILFLNEINYGIHEYHLSECHSDTCIQLERQHSVSCNHRETLHLVLRNQYETLHLVLRNQCETLCLVYCETEFLKLSYDKSTTYEDCLVWNTQKSKIISSLHVQRFPYTFSCSLFLSIFKCKILEYSFLRNSMRKHDHIRYWLEQYLNYISSFSYSYCISRQGSKKKRILRSKCQNILLSATDEYADMKNSFKNLFCAGGRHQTFLNGEIVWEYLQSCTDPMLSNNNQYFQGKQFEFKGYKDSSTTSNDGLEPLFFSKIPLHQLSKYLNMKELRDMSVIHGIPVPQQITKKTMLTYFLDHHCTQCDLYVSILTENKPKIKIRSKKKESAKPFDLPSKFPPDPPSNSLVESIIRGFCHDISPQNFIEGGCAVCGRLTPLNNMVLLNEMKCDLSVISPGDIGRHERLHISDPIIPLKGPILAENCSHVCQSCQGYLKKGKKPPESLANSFWIGAVPPILQNLTFAEKMLISKIRHNKCLVRVSSGRAKMTANVIMFSNPTVKVYHALPPSRQEISEILAFVFQGPIKPTDTDIKRTPMLVRRNTVKDALEWLKLNHTDYEDLHISLENLKDYPLAGVPVNIEYSMSDADSGNKIVTAMSVHDDEFEDGTTDGPCPFTVHGLTGPEFENMSLENLKARALQHLIENGSTLGISHDSKPQSMYDNPQAYPQMFPWLFPYGFGGIGQKCHFAKLSETKQKQNLLMYHDKRFQTDFYFPMIAFNHDQLKAGVTGSFLLAKRKKWPDISKRLNALNRDVLKNISIKLSTGTHFIPKTTEEKNCFQLLKDLDHVGGFVKGSITSKKHMRNEIWSMISQLGAPSWFITLSPADNRHPVCLYYADKDIKFKPDLRSANERNILVAQNPVAAARFFDLMIRMFIKHVLGIGTEHSGLYGNTAGYYGTVEQQGQLTLHLHTVLWIKNALSPQEIRNKLMNKDGEFQQNLIQYLEGCQKGEFLTGSMEYVKSKVPTDTRETHSKGIHTIFDNETSQCIGRSYQDPTQTVPEAPPNPCDSNKHINCIDCLSLRHWWTKFQDTVDDILLRSNVHKCSSSDPGKLKFKAKGCLNQNGLCKARFPRPIIPETTVNVEDGYINMKKTESMLNTISPCITYIFRCNTDVTSMLSGTSIKAVISYVTDYICKPTLKTHQIFATAYNVFDRNSKLENGNALHTDDARKLILKIVNALSAKMEIGSPMAAMYLLQNPDHYTSHKFIPFWWKTFVNDVRRSEMPNGSLTYVEKNKTQQNHEIDIIMENISQDKLEPFSRSTKEINLDDPERNIKNTDPYEQIASLTSDFEMNVDNNKNHIGERHRTICETIPSEEYLHSKSEIEHEDESGYKDEIENEDSDEVESENENEEGDDDDDDDPTDEKLLISQDGRDYIVSSKVDDYKYRPEAYKKISLYNWTKLSVKVKASCKNNDKTYLHFLPGHSSRNTHKVKCIPSRSDTFILNFIGGSLPRRDQGDFEYYCCTMLTLFKPWRNDQDLKNTNQTWSEAFALYNFSIEDKKIMNNFNLRYECLDERDDYHAILKNQTKLHEKNTSSLIQDHYDNDCDLGIHPNVEEDYGDQTVLGPNAIKKAQQMLETEIMMNKAGWLDDTNKTESQTNPIEFHPNIYKTGADWKSIVKQCRENLLKVKKISYSSATSTLRMIKDNILQPLAVKLLPAEYFMRDFQVKNDKDHKIILNTILDFSLNEEQKRAFQIIANHASETYPQQLKMYLGGMGGTGKSQVIKALISMFNQRQESHRFIVLAPTGTAAALLNGSTYHSMLGIRSSNLNGEDERIRNENSVIREVQERLEGVDYIFIDEISMIACHELYMISSQLSKVTNEYDKPFGGKNIIFAGDFAQLPPTNGSPLYSNMVSKTQKSTMSKRDQESTIGKILWHQVTAVVILIQNMRQTEMSEKDQRFRTALSNMRYAACTKDDLDFLKTLLVNENENDSPLTDPRFRNVSIITSLNTQKDQINDLGSIRFARDTGQKLTHFFSIDKPGNASIGRKKRGLQTSKKISAGVDIPFNIQKTLWDCSPHSSEHFPGKLSLCLGMPIMIRNNDATELCITKGQEAYVVGWDAIQGPQGQNVLETLYLELKNPPKTIQLPHLPKNTIPMTRSSKTIKCSLPNDYEINVIRQQVNVLPNFSMTDYASQGKTRPYNVVNLSHCKNFQSIYTCLSRSSNAAGTLIVQGFNSAKITQGLSGHLRQEFRELHLLNDITKKIYEGQINKKYFGQLRNPMIYKYQTELNIRKNPNDLHYALKWSDDENFIKIKEENGTWNLNIYQNFTSSALKNDKENLKRKLPASQAIIKYTDAEKNPKKIRTSLLLPSYFNAQSPLGLSWDSIDYSCAYDSLFTILHHIWNEGQSKHKAYFENGTEYLQILHSRFILLSTNQCTFENIRNHLRTILNHEKPLQYLFGKNYTDLDELVRDFSLIKSYGTSHLQCLNCKFAINKQYSYFQDYTTVGWCSSDYEKLKHTASIQQYLNFKINKNNHKSNKICPNCRKSKKKDVPLYLTQYINELPAILIFALAPWIDINKTLVFDVSNSSKKYILKGIIYTNGNHFTARLIDEYLNVWYHDGQTTYSLCQREQLLTQIEKEDQLKKYGQYTAIMAFYAEE